MNSVVPEKCTTTAIEYDEAKRVVTTTTDYPKGTCANKVLSRRILTFNADGDIIVVVEEPNGGSSSVQVEKSKTVCK